MFGLSEAKSARAERRGNWQNPLVDKLIAAFERDFRGQHRQRQGRGPFIRIGFEPPLRGTATQINPVTAGGAERDLTRLHSPKPARTASGSVNEIVYGAPAARVALRSASSNKRSISNVRNVLPISTPVQSNVKRPSQERVQDFVEWAEVRFDLCQ